MKATIKMRVTPITIHVFRVGRARQALIRNIFDLRQVGLEPCHSEICRPNSKTKALSASGELHWPETGSASWTCLRLPASAEVSVNFDESQKLIQLSLSQA